MGARIRLIAAIGGFAAILILLSLWLLTDRCFHLHTIKLDQASNRDKVAVPSRIYTLAADYASNATTVQVNELPQHDDSLVIDPSKSNGRSFIRTWTGTGPYTCTIFPGVPTARATGYVVPTSNVGDNAGLHPSPQGHQIIAGAALSWKTGISL